MSDTKEIKPYKNKGTCLELEKNDLTAILNMTIEKSTERMGRPYHYPPNKVGLEEFIQNTIDYFEYVNALNSNDNLERKLIPDIENWCTFLGIARSTLFNYEQRGTEWKECIDFYKNAIASVKKQLALHYKVPPMVFAFDMANNHNYINTSEFKATVTVDQELTKDTQLERTVSDMGLVWDSDKHEWVAM